MAGTSPSAFIDASGNTFVYYVGADDTLWSWYLEPSQNDAWVNWQVQWSGQTNEPVAIASSTSALAAGG